MNAVFPIRKEKIQEVKNKIFRKLYDTNELKEETVNKLVQSEEFGNIVNNYTLSRGKKEKLHSDYGTTEKVSPKPNVNDSSNSGVRQEKIKEVKEKKRRGYYNSPEVFSKIAQRLIDLFGT